MLVVSLVFVTFAYVFVRVSVQGSVLVWCSSLKLHWALRRRGLCAVYESRFYETNRARVCLRQQQQQRSMLPLWKKRSSDLNLGRLSGCGPTMEDSTNEVHTRTTWRCSARPYSGANKRLCHVCVEAPVLFAIALALHVTLPGSRLCYHPCGCSPGCISVSVPCSSRDHVVNPVDP